MRVGRLQGAVGVWRISLILVLCGGDVGPGPAVGAGLRDYADGWLLDLQDGAAVLSGHEVPGKAPVGQEQGSRGQPGWGLWAGAGQGLLYSLEELPLSSVGLGIVRHRGRLPWLVSGTWERLGEELLVEETGTLRLRVGGRFRVGTRIRARSWEVAGVRVASHAEANLDVALDFWIRPDFRCDVGIRIHPVGAPSWHGPGSRRTVAEVKFFLNAAALAIRIDQRADGAPVVAAEVLARMSPCLGWGLRADPETGTLGGGLTLDLKSFWLRTSHLVHPALGATHRFGVGAGDPEASPW